MTCDIIDVTDTTFACVFDGYLDVTSEFQLGMLLSLIVAVPLYAKYEDPVIPAIALALLGGVMWPVLPGFLTGVAWAILFFALTIGVFTSVYRLMIR